MVKNCWSPHIKTLVSAGLHPVKQETKHGIRWGCRLFPSFQKWRGYEKCCKIPACTRTNVCDNRTWHADVALAPRGRNKFRNEHASPRLKPRNPPAIPRLLLEPSSRRHGVRPNCSQNSPLPRSTTTLSWSRKTRSCRSANPGLRGTNRNPSSHPKYTPSPYTVECRSWNVGYF